MGRLNQAAYSPCFTSWFQVLPRSDVVPGPASLRRACALQPDVALQRPSGFHRDDSG